MSNIRFPRSGSMQVWPRKKAKRHYPRIRSWAKAQKSGLLGFAGFKVGMTHVLAIDSTPNSLTKTQTISVPVTVIECPPIKIVSAVFYTTTLEGKKIIKEITADKIDKELSRKIKPAKQNKSKFDDIKEFTDITVKVYTQPKLASVGQKTPHLFEVGLGGSKEEKLAFVKEHLGKEVKLQEVFHAGEHVDIHAVTKGKGFQGPVKRFGVSIRRHKSEKTKRGPGSLGGWKAQGKVMYRVAHAGQMGYHTRTEYNKWLVHVGEDGKDINPKGGFRHYGNVNNTYLLIKGSVAGPQKRIVRFAKASRPNKKIPTKPFEIKLISSSAR